jgi:hypothetical protein
LRPAQENGSRDPNFKITRANDGGGYIRLKYYPGTVGNVTMYPQYSNNNHDHNHNNKWPEQNDLEVRLKFYSTCFASTHFARAMS